MDSSDDTDTVRERRPPRAGGEAEHEESAAPDTGRRWRDLSLNFDAEPVAPRPRRGEPPAKRSPGGHTPPARPAAPTDRHDGAITKPDPAPQDAAEDAAPAHEATELDEPVLDDDGATSSDIAAETGAVPALEPLEGASEAPAREASPHDVEKDVEEESDEEPLIEYYDRGGPAAPREAGDAVDEDTTTLEIELPDVTQDEDGGEAIGREPDEPGEDQLHLELESAEGIKDDIPTLTDAVYIPEAQPQGPEIALPGPEIAPPEPDTSPYDDGIERCLENLRVRLQLMGLDVLSAGQERELRDTLVEFLDDQGFSSGGNA
jgi:hypothetical protein